MAKVGDDIISFEPDSPVGVTTHSFTDEPRAQVTQVIGASAVYTAFTSEGEKLYSNRISFDLREDSSGPESYEHVHKPKVIAYGYDDIEIYDPINSKGQISYWSQKGGEELVQVSDGGYDIDFYFELTDFFNMEMKLKEYIFGAVDKWESVIIGDLPNEGLIDDIVIYIAKTEKLFKGPELSDENLIVIAEGAPYKNKRAQTKLPFGSSVNLIYFMDENNIFASPKPHPHASLDVITHEMGHALGFSITPDKNVELGITQRPDETPTPLLTGGNAYREYRAIFGDIKFLPLWTETGIHWFEWETKNQVPDQDPVTSPGLANELMTPFVHGEKNPLSRITIGFMEDLGYVVDYSKADPFTKPINNGSATFFINGIPAEGNTLTATNSSPDPDGSGMFTYRWQISSNGSSWSPVGTNISSYLVASADQGKQLRLVVTYFDGDGFEETVTITAGNVPLLPATPTATFSISGTPAVGNTLTATNSAPDPHGNGAFTYSWQSSTNGTTWNPVGTNSPSYLIASADQGKQLRLMVTYSDGEGFPETVTTGAGSVPLENDGTASFFISGIPAVGSTLTATTSSADPDGNGTFSYSWQALADGSTWSTVGTGTELNIGQAQEGQQLRLVISYTDGQGFSEYVTTAAGTVPIGSTPPASITVDIPSTPTGSRVLVGSTDAAELIANLQGSPDLIEIQVPVTATLNAISTETWTSRYVAYNVGSSTKDGTGERISLNGIGKYSFVALAIPEATTEIVLELGKNTAFFLHDAYSAFYSGITLTADSTGRLSAARLLDIDTIRMGSAGGTSIVDLTSKDYITGAVTVHGADKGRSVFWGIDADDTFISGGGDSLIYGGAGTNRFILGAGVDTLQYRMGVGAQDLISNFDPANDKLQLWRGRDDESIVPTFLSTGSDTTVSWAGNALTFLNVPNLSLSNLQISQHTALT